MTIIRTGSVSITAINNYIENYHGYPSVTETESNVFGMKFGNLSYEFYGKNLKYSGGDILTGGTITGLKVTYRGSEVINLSKMDYPVKFTMNFAITDPEYLGVHLLHQHDTAFGTIRNDIIELHDGNDTARGGGGNDHLSGGNGHDALYGEAGNDVLYGHDERNDSDIGNDRLDGGDGNDRLYGAGGNDLLIGGNGHDRLYGENGRDTLNGGAGNDTLYGATPDIGSHVSLLNRSEVLIGGSGNDRLYFLFGSDTLSGGSGSDYYVFDDPMTSKSLDGSGVATIRDFTRGQDRIDLRDAGIDAYIGTDAFTPFSLRTEARFQNGKLLINTDADPTPEFTLILSGVKTLTASDIIL